MNLDDLERKAKEATPGPREVTIDGRKLIVWKPGGTFDRLAYLDELPDGADLQFIVAASPDVVLKLIDVAHAAICVRDTDPSNVIARTYLETALDALTRL